MQCFSPYVCEQEDVKMNTLGVHRLLLLLLSVTTVYPRSQTCKYIEISREHVTLCCCCWSVASRYGHMLVYLRNGSAQTKVRAATLGQKL